MGLGAATLKRELLKIVDRFSRCRLAILGDFLLDQFLFGEISRVSREAPVLILSYRETESKPGGGANTVAGVAALGALTYPVGYLGEDDGAQKLLELWPDRVDPAHLIRESGLHTTLKKRILAGSSHSFRQQVVRIDHEHPLQLTRQQQQQLKEVLRRLLPQVDALVISDYSLGTTTSEVRRVALEVARAHGLPVVVDSRFDPGGFGGATAITPNITEVEHATGLRMGNDTQLLLRTGLSLRSQWDLEALLITRGKLGMTLFTEEGARHIPIYGSDQVTDVTGAGDTVTSTLTTALAAGADFCQAALLANCAAGIVVTKRGTATVSATELRQALDRFELDSNDLRLRKVDVPVKHSL